MEKAGWIGRPWPEFNEGLLYTDTVKYPPSAQAESLLEYYSSRYKESGSKQGWVQRIRNSQIRVDGNVITKENFLLRSGASLVYNRLPWQEPDVPCRIDILHEDDHLIALNKPSGLQVLPGGLFQQRTVLQQLQWRSAEQEKQMEDQSTMNSLAEPTSLWKSVPVHRLGRGTSGVLLCAKSLTAKCRLAADLAAATSAITTGRGKEGDLEANRRITKTYRALASGLIMENEIAVDIPIGKLQYSGVAGGLYMASEKGGKPSRSKVTVLWRNLVKNESLVEEDRVGRHTTVLSPNDGFGVQIYTGRPHQIRIHLAALGHPLVGDPLYVSGGRPRGDLATAIVENAEEVAQHPAEDGGYQRPSISLPGDCGYFLHAWRLSFTHPITSQKMDIIAPPPPQLCGPRGRD